MIRKNSFVVCNFYKATKTGNTRNPSTLASAYVPGAFRWRRGSLALAVGRRSAQLHQAGLADRSRPATERTQLRHLSHLCNTTASQGSSTSYLQFMLPLKLHLKLRSPKQIQETQKCEYFLVK